ncbi:hypothetical protein TELCIR_01578 [Teladorsagia circumcincta]|uniref:Uncharacterized protein n=1 Tax=Teladorsagia circumcincta TaxID=45464 RepID=A0A2G9V1J5_TELCI|nr:hypothetical protein TELCIR_01578 [Teladorsagia circumcincta]
MYAALSAPKRLPSNPKRRVFMAMAPFGRDCVARCHELTKLGQSCDSRCDMKSLENGHPLLLTSMYLAYIDTQLYTIDVLPD